MSDTRILFALNPGQAHRAGLDPDQQWLGVLTTAEGQRVSHLTNLPSVFEAMRLHVETGTKPPAEFADWCNEQIVTVRGWPEDWLSA